MTTLEQRDVLRGTNTGPVEGHCGRARNNKSMWCLWRGGLVMRLIWISVEFLDEKYDQHGINQKEQSLFTPWDRWSEHYQSLWLLCTGFYHFCTHRLICTVQNQSTNKSFMAAWVLSAVSIVSFTVWVVYCPHNLHISLRSFHFIFKYTSSFAVCFLMWHDCTFFFLAWTPSKQRFRFQGTILVKQAKQASSLPAMTANIFVHLVSPCHRDKTWS